MPKPLIKNPQAYPTVLYTEHHEMRSLKFISRWAGHVKWPFSVMDHSVLGAMAFLNAGEEELACAFMLHDVEEGMLVGDVKPVEKKKYLNQAYHDRVDEIRKRLAFTYGVNLRSQAVKAMDAVMLAQEWDYIAYEVRTDAIINKAKSVTKNWEAAHSIGDILRKSWGARGTGTIHDSYSIYQTVLRPLLIKRAKNGAIFRDTAANMPFSFPDHLK